MNLTYRSLPRLAIQLAWYFRAHPHDPTALNHDVWLKRMGLIESWFLKYNNVCGDGPRTLKE